MLDARSSASSTSDFNYAIDESYELRVAIDALLIVFDAEGSLPGEATEKQRQEVVAWLVLTIAEERQRHYRKLAAKTEKRKAAVTLAAG